MKNSQHRPPHIYLDTTWYVITAGTHKHMPLFTQRRAKDCLRDSLKFTAAKFSISLHAWVVLSDHYHLLLKSSQGSQLPSFFNHLHGSTSRQVNLQDRVTGRKVWYNYWDTCIRTEADFWTRFNYIHFNPVKHGYVEHPGDWHYSSFDYYLRSKGKEWLDDCVACYPVIDTLGGDDFPNAPAAPAA